MTDEKYEALPGLTDEQKDEIQDFVSDRYGVLIDNLTDEAAGYLNVTLNEKAKEEVRMHLECVILTILKEEYEDEEEEKKVENG